MYLVSLYSGYFKWHYSGALKDSFVVATNLIWFVSNLFSIGLLFRTLFAPWKRVTESHDREAGIEDYFATIAVNMMSRVVGAFIRLAVIAVGLLALLFSLVLTAAFYVVWLTAPALLPLMFLYGLVIIF